MFSAIAKCSFHVHRGPKNITTVLQTMLRKVAGKRSLTDASDVHGVASLGASAVTPSCLGQTWGSLPAFRSWEELAVWLGLDWPLTSLLRTMAPPLSTSATASPSLCLSVLSFSDRLSTCHSHLASTLAPVLSSSWSVQPSPPPSPLGAFEYISPDIRPLT